MTYSRALASLGILLASGCSGFDSCFAGTTLIATPGGPRPIRDLAIGDDVWSYDHVAGRFAIGKVTAIHRARGAIRSVRTDAGVLAAVTDPHPLFVASRAEFVAAGELAAGATLLHWNGDPESPPRETEVLGFASPAPGDSVEVFNLTVGDAHSTFFADGFYVHNKEIAVDPCPSGPVVGLYVPSTICVGAQKHVSVSGACEATQELLDSVVLATNNPSVLVVEGRMATAVAPGTATITALVDGKPRTEASILVQECASDAGADADSGTD